MATPETLPSEIKAELAAITRGALPWRPREVAAQRCNDIYNGRQFAADHSDRFRYAPGMGWMFWNDFYWTSDLADLQAMRAARDTVARLFTLGLEGNDDELRKWANASASKGKLDAMIAMASSEDGIAVNASAFDRDPWVITTASGNVNLRTGALTDHDPAAMVTKFMPAAYTDLPARCPLFLNFLDRIFAGNADLIGFVQRLLGYGLTSDVSEHILPIWCGGGANGKTTLQEVVRSIMGSYSMSAPASVLMASRGDGIPNDIARLRGARFVALAETEDGKRLNETLIKTLTGGDTVVARFLYKEFFEFRMTAKFVLSTNHRPEVRGQDHGIWRRLRLVPFDVTIPEADRDRHMKEKLLTEQAGILRWMVEGCLEWQRIGLGEPETVTAATAAYKRDEDTLSDFMEECCVIVPDIKTTFAAVYKRYLGWMKREGMERVSMSRKALSARLRNRSTTEGFVYGKSNKGPYFLGLALLPEGGDGDR